MDGPGEFGYALCEDWLRYCKGGKQWQATMVAVNFSPDW